MIMNLYDYSASGAMRKTNICSRMHVYRHCMSVASALPYNMHTCDCHRVTCLSSLHYIATIIAACRRHTMPTVSKPASVFSCKAQLAPSAFLLLGAVIGKPCNHGDLSLEGFCWDLFLRPNPHTLELPRSIACC